MQADLEEKMKSGLEKQIQTTNEANKSKYNELLAVYQDRLLESRAAWEKEKGQLMSAKAAEWVEKETQQAAEYEARLQDQYKTLLDRHVRAAEELVKDREEREHTDWEEREGQMAEAAITMHNDKAEALKRRQQEYNVLLTSFKEQHDKAVGTMETDHKAEMASRTEQFQVQVRF
jgi:hypothetical protein